MKNVTLSLLAAAAMGAISIGSASAMPVSNLAGLSESHVRMSAWSATVLGDATTRAAPIAHIHMRSVITVMATIPAMVVATILAMVLATDLTADRVSELVSARSASALGNPQLSSNNFGPAVLKTGGFVTSGRLQIFCVPAMTALGQKQTCAVQLGMSAKCQERTSRR